MTAAVTSSTASASPSMSSSSLAPTLFASVRTASGSGVPALPFAFASSRGDGHQVLHDLVL